MKRPRITTTAKRIFTLVVQEGHLQRKAIRYDRCADPGCLKAGDSYYYPDDSETVLCFDHAGTYGFCVGCHLFWAGCESFETSRTGLCENCESDNFDFDEDDEEWEDYPDMYDRMLWYNF